MTGVIAGLALSATGMIAQVAAVVQGVAPAVEKGSDLAPWLQGGGSAAAVAGLVYVARMIVKGDLVPRAVAEREQETNVNIRVAAEQASKAQELTKTVLDLAHESHAREQALATVVGDNVRATTQQVELARQVSEELRWWRERRDASTRRGGA